MTKKISRKPKTVKVLYLIRFIVSFDNMSTEVKNKKKLKNLNFEKREDKSWDLFSFWINRKQ